MEGCNRFDKLGSQHIVLSVVFVILALKPVDASWSGAGGGEGYRAAVESVPPRSQVRYGAGNQAVTNATAQLGSSAFLHCSEPSRPADRPTQVSWLRRRDWSLLTSGRERFTQDERFHVYHDPRAATWVLKISHVRREDRGLYECQISASAGREAKLVYLQVVQPVANIHGSGAYHVERGSAMSLTCSVKQVVSTSIFVVWRHNGEAFNPYRLRPDMKMKVRHAPHQTVSTLSIRDVRLSDGGNYTCSAGSARAATVAVFVSQGDTMAAVQRRKATSSAARRLLPPPSSALLFLIVCSLVKHVIR